MLHRSVAVWAGRAYAVVLGMSAGIQAPAKQTARGLASRLRGDLVGGAVGALIAIPTVLSCGIVFFAGIGPGFAAAGIASAFVSAVICALVAGVFGGRTLHVNSPKTSHAAILAGLTATVAAQPGFISAFPGAAAAPALMTVCFLTILVSGAVQFGLGAARLGAAVKFVPHPVLAGFVNGFALQIIIGQLPKLAGVDHLHQLADGLLSWPALGMGVLAVVLMQLAPRLTRAVPAPLLGLAGGTLAWLALAQFLPAEGLGPLIGALPENLIPLPQVFAMGSLITTPGFLPLAFPVLATGVTLAMVSSIQSLLSIAGADRLADTRHDSNAELMVQGGGNLLAALFGGTPSGGSANITQTVFTNGGRSRVANLAHAGALVVLAFGLGRLIALVPVSVMAAVVIASTATGYDKWTRQLFSRMRTTTGAGRTDVLVNLGVVLIVTALVVLAGALVALGIGMSLAFMIFLYRASEQAVRRVLRADGVRSRTSRTRQASTALDQQGRRIAVVELEGALFFGSAESVVQRVEAELPTADWLVLDFRRVGMIDSSGAMGLKRIDDMMKKQRKRLLLAYLPPGSDKLTLMRSAGFGAPEREGRTFVDTDTALGVAEAELLASLGLADPGAEELPLAAFEALQGLDAAQLTQLAACLVRHDYAAEQPIIRRGEAGRSMFLLTRGQVSVRIGGAGAVGTLRLFCYEAGIVFGEMALLSGQPRSADVLADTPAVVQELTAAAFERLSAEVPAIAITLIRNLAVELSTRIRTQTETIRQLEA